MLLKIRKEACLGVPIFGESEKTFDHDLQEYEQLVYQNLKLYPHAFLTLAPPNGDQLR